MAFLEYAAGVLGESLANAAVSLAVWAIPKRWQSNWIVGLVGAALAGGLALYASTNVDVIAASAVMGVFVGRFTSRLANGAGDRPREPRW